MKPHILLVIIAIATFHAHAMEEMMILNAKNYVMKGVKSPLLSQKTHAQPLAIAQNETQIFPNEIWDKIIVLCSHKELGSLKETCKQLSALTSVNRLNTFVMHNFSMLGHQSILFRAIIRTSNPELITIIMNYAKKETKSLLHPTDAVCINIEPLQSIQKVRVRRYATHLMQEALKQYNEIMIEALEKEDYDTEVIEHNKEMLKYEQEAKRNYPRLKYGAAILATGFIGACSFIGWAISTSPKHTTYNNTTYSPITMPPSNFH